MAFRCGSYLEFDLMTGHMRAIAQSLDTSAEQSCCGDGGACKEVLCGADAIARDGNMWDVPAFQAWLTAVYGTATAWQQHIVPAMRSAVTTSLRCCQPSVEHRPASCQLYGYDFAVDERFHVWLLEINSSPSMEASTPVTERLCAQVQEDVLKV